MLKKYKPLFLLKIILLAILPFNGRSQTDTYTTTGNTDWVVPACVYTISVQVWGAGGAGGGATSTDRNGGGGGGGAYCSYVENVTPGETIRITVGAGGTGASAGTGGAGGASQVQHLTGAVVFCKAAGGSGGAMASSSSTAGAGGAGGQIANNIPVSTGFKGGNGGNSNATTSSSDQSGGGGGGAGTTANGSNGTIITAGAGGASGGGNGGAGISTTTNGGSNGSAGNTIGGGGGGSTVFNTGSRAGGNGARGEVRITYAAGSCCPTPAIPTGITGNTAPCTGATETYTTASSGATSFTWELPAGWSIISGANTNSITVYVGVAGGAVAVSPGNSCGTLSPTILGITLCSASPADMVYSSPGTYTWVVPSCVSSVYVQAWGGGGGGGGIAAEGINCTICSYVEACSGGGGGGGGGYTSRSYAVNTGETYTIVVGAGGTGGAASNSSTATARDGGVGGSSTFSGPATTSLGTLTALGGGYGQGARTLHTGSSPDHQGSNGTGGTGSSGSNGTVTKTGGNGATGMHSASCWDLSGGGGGGAGSTSNGSNATTLVCYGGVGGGTGGASDGGAGAAGIADNGISTQSYAGNTGTSIGGGGGGALDHSRNWLNSWITQAGGAGARGEVRLTYGSCILLPVSLASFEGKCSGKEKEITWVTMSEQNNKYFTLEHSVNGLDFYPVKIVPGHGNSSSKQTYNVNISDGAEYKYYKLTQTDLNGTTRTFNTIFIDCSTIVADFVLYPNPAQENLSVLFGKNMEGTRTIVITDIIGRILYTTSVTLEVDGRNETTINVENLAAGNYVAEIWSEDFSKRIGAARFVKN